MPQKHNRTRPPFDLLERDKTTRERLSAGFPLLACDSNDFPESSPDLALEWIFRFLDAEIPCQELGESLHKECTMVW